VCWIIVHISYCEFKQNNNFFDAPLQQCTSTQKIYPEAMIISIITIMNMTCVWLQCDENIHFFIFQSHKLLKTHFDWMIYNIGSCFVCVSGCFAAVQYMGDINCNPRGVQKVHTRTHTRRHIFLAVLLLNKFFFFPKFHSGIVAGGRKWGVYGSKKVLTFSVFVITVAPVFRSCIISFVIYK
jgi:hypothetical protein